MTYIYNVSSFIFLCAINTAAAFSTNTVSIDQFNSAHKEYLIKPCGWLNEGFWDVFDADGEKHAMLVEKDGILQETQFSSGKYNLEFTKFLELYNIKVAVPIAAAFSTNTVSIDQFNSAHKEYLIKPCGWLNEGFWDVFDADGEKHAMLVEKDGILQETQFSSGKYNLEFTKFLELYNIKVAASNAGLQAKSYQPKRTRVEDPLSLPPISPGYLNPQLNDGGKTILLENKLLLSKKKAEVRIFPQTRHYETRYYSATFGLNISPDELASILRVYDLEVVEGMFRNHKDKWQYELHQIYESGQLGQLTNLLEYLKAQKYLKDEDILNPKNLWIADTPVSDDQLTALFDGQPLTAKYISSKLSLPCDIYYQSEHMFRDPEESKKLEETLEQDLVKNIELKLKHLISHGAYHLAKPVLEVASRFHGKSNRISSATLEKYNVILNSK